LKVAPDLQRVIDEQRVRMAGAQLPADMDDATRAALKQAINESFVFGYRLVMTSAVGLALASAFSAFLLIDGNRKSRSS
jgi:hypothetical protein